MKNKNMEKLKDKNPYKSIEGAHYGTEKKFETYEERGEYLKSYVKESEQIYKKYEEKGGETIKDKEDFVKFKQYRFYQIYESDFILITSFRDKIRKTSRIANLIKEGERTNLDKEKLNQLKVRFAAAKVDVARIIKQLGPILEYVHRKVLRSEAKYNHEFKPLSKKEQELELLFETPTGETIIGQEMYDTALREAKKEKSDLKDKLQKKVIKIAEGRDYLRYDEDLDSLMNDEDFLAILNKIGEYKDGKNDLIAVCEEMVGEKELEEVDQKSSLSKPEIEKELKITSQKLDELWRSDLVRHKFFRDYLKNLVIQDQLGEPALEIPSVVKFMNELMKWEIRHPESIIGGVVIGPPGTGKSLGIEHYLMMHPKHKKKGAPIVIDMSQETTETILLGGENIEVTDKASTVRMISNIFKEKEEIERAIKNGESTEQEKKILKERMEKSNKNLEDLIHTYVSYHIEEKRKAEEFKEDLIDKIAESGFRDLSKLIKESSLKDLKLINSDYYNRFIDWTSNRLDKAIASWQALELGKIVYGNGWRDGIMLKALKEGRDIIINEYNNFSITPDAIRQLLQTAYGEKWFYAGSQREYEVRSRLYFTANEGSSAEQFFFDTAAVSAAFESRLSPPIEMNIPAQEEEVLIAMAKLSDNNLSLLTKEKAHSRLFAIQALKDAEFNLEYQEPNVINYLFKKVLPRLRALSYVKPRSIPSLDLRHLDRFCRELVNRHTRERNRVSIEEAFVRHFLIPFKSKPEAWRALVESNIVIDDMYKVGLLHDEDKDGFVKKFLIQLMADKMGKRLEHVDESARISILSDIETEFQNYDSELIKNIQDMEDVDWEKVVKVAKKENKVFLFNPYLKEQLSDSFSKTFIRPQALAF